MMSIVFKPGLLICALTASLSLAGCGVKSPAELLEAGKVSMQKKDYNAAAIELKNALQQDSNNAEARFLLGKSLLEMGRPSEALIELTKARELGYPLAHLVVPLGSAMMSQGEVSQFIAEYANVQIDDPKTRAEFKATLSAAYGAQGKYRQSREAVDAALQADPANITAKLLVAQLLRVDGDDAGALAQIERTIANAPEAGAPWLAKAEQLLIARDTAGALAAYREALQRMPENVLVHVGIIQELIRQRDFDGAQRQLAQLEKLQPKGVQGRYLAAMVAYERRDLKPAFEEVQELLRIAPNNPRLLHLAGAVEYERGNYLQAVAHLGKALPDSPAPVAVRVLLARAQLRAGDPRKALTFLQPLLDGPRARVPAEVYSLAAECYAQSGDGAAAKKMYAKAVEINPADERGRTVLAVSALKEGRAEQGMAELKAIAGSASGSDAEIAMVMAHVGANRLDEALAVLDGLERKQPGKPIAPFIRGRIEQLRGHRDKAREFYEQAVTREASYSPAVVALAVLDLDDNKPASAVSRYEKLVVAAPKDVGARLGLIAARVRAGAKAGDVRTQLEEAVKLFPDSESARITLVGTLLDQRDAQAAVKAARDALARFPDSAGLLLGQGLAELALGNHNQAAQSLSKAASLQPQSVDALMHLVDVEMARKDVQAALAQLRKVLAIKPDHIPAQVRLVGLLARLSKTDEAMGIAQSVQKQFPDNPTGWALEADLLALKGNRVGAVLALKTAFAKRPSDDTAIGLHNAMRAAGQTVEADKLADGWLAKQPDSATFHNYLGEQAIGQRDYEGAERHLRKVITIQPSNALVLNNLAWVLYRAGKPGALEMGEKALALAPDSDAVLDTVAEILASTGRMDRALTLQKRAVERSPNMPVLRLHLAQYLIKSGQKPQARTELERLAALGSGFAGQDEVQKLLASL